MNESSQPPLHWYLKRNATGKIVVCWRRFGLIVAGTVAGGLVGVVIVRYFSGMPIRPARIAVPAVLVILPQFLILHAVKRRAEERPLWQFSLFAILVAMTVACVLLSLIVLDRRADFELHAARRALETALARVAGTGAIHVGEQSLIQVKRANFSDADLRAMLDLIRANDRADSAIYNIDLSGTAVTDAGVELLKDVPKLEYCFLSQTQITDASIDALEDLPKLKILQVQSTNVTPERLLRLSSDRPQLSIEPKTYQRLKNPVSQN